MFIRMKKIALQSIKVTLNIIYVPLYITNKICSTVNGFLNVQQNNKKIFSWVPSGVFGFINELLDKCYGFWDPRNINNPHPWSMKKELLEISLNLLLRLVTLPFIAVLAIANGVIMLVANILSTISYILDDIAMEGINKLIADIDSCIDSYDTDASSQIGGISDEDISSNIDNLPSDSKSLTTLYNNQVSKIIVNEHSENPPLTNRTSYSHEASKFTNY